MRKFSLDIKIEIYKEYKKGRSLQDLSKEYEMNFSNLRYMVKFIDKYGIEEYMKPNHYSNDLKEYLIQRVINNEDTTESLFFEKVIENALKAYGRVRLFISIILSCIFTTNFAYLLYNIKKEKPIIS